VASVAFTPAAAQRNELAQSVLGVMYVKGPGLGQNLVRAHMRGLISLPQHRPATCWPGL